MCSCVSSTLLLISLFCVLPSLAARALFCFSLSTHAKEATVNNWNGRGCGEDYDCGDERSRYRNASTCTVRTEGRVLFTSGVLFSSRSSKAWVKGFPNLFACLFVYGWG